MLLRFLALVAVIWIVLLPPLFTRGACTHQFDAESQRIEADRASLADPSHAMQYWQSRQVPAFALSKETCRRARPRFLADCGDGVLVYARVPVSNLVCRIYRDDTVLVQLQYNDRNRLARVQVDMSPYKSLPLPWFGTAIDWAR
jgi:hypothetical protein